MREIRGKEVVTAIKEKIQKDVASLNGYIPKLAIVRVGEEPDDVSYEKGAIRNLTSQGLQAVSFSYPANISNQEFLSELKKIDDDNTVDGILLLKPLPDYIDEKAALEVISPEKDIDGAEPINRMKMLIGDDSGFVPCTAQAVIEILDYAGVDLKGKHVTVVGYGMNVGRPLTSLLLNRLATVSVCHAMTPRADLERLCKESDIIVSAAGKAGLIGVSCMKEGVVVVDVGINMGEDGKLCGDIKYDEIQDVASIATPVPGGVGAVTTTILAQQLVKAAMLKQNKITG